MIKIFKILSSQKMFGITSNLNFFAKLLNFVIISESDFLIDQIEKKINELIEN